MKNCRHFAICDMKSSRHFAICEMKMKKEWKPRKVFLPHMTRITRIRYKSANGQNSTRGYRSKTSLELIFAPTCKNGYERFMVWRFGRSGF
jgi:hypothetical protein